jgi:hypothetical protein
MVSLASSLLPPTVSLGREFSLDGRTIALATTASAVVALAWGLLSGSGLGSREVMPMLTGRNELQASRHRGRYLLVGSQVAVALVVVVAALVARAEIDRKESLDPGFSADGVVVAHVAVSIPRLRQIYGTLGSRLPENERVNGPDGKTLDRRLSSALAARDLLREVRTSGGIQATAVSSLLPLMPQPDHATVSVSLAAEGASDRSEASATQIEVSDDYLRVMGIPILSGRHFGPSDRLGSEPVAIISRDLADRMQIQTFGELARIRVGQEMLRVVGVAGSVTLSNPGEPATPIVYRPFAQVPAGTFIMAARASATAAGMRQ